MTKRRPRPAARIFLRNPAGELLLFRFVAADRSPFWCTPGGAVELGETYAMAAWRELYEETGITHDVGEEVLQRVVEFTTLEGEDVIADERYFLMDVDDGISISLANHSPLEQQVMQAWRWFSSADLRALAEPVFPADIADILDQLNG